MTTELKPCPFCGRKVTVYYMEFSQAYMVTCRNHGCSAVSCCATGKTEEKVIENWNRRASGWVPVNERNPKPVSDVLVAYIPFGRSKRIGVAQSFPPDCHDTEDIGVYNIAGDANSKSGFTEVLYWMPLTDWPEEVHEHEHA